MTSSGGRARVPRERLAWIAALLCGVVFVVMELVASRDESLTWDEPGYIAAGYANLVQGDYRLNADHPPLLQKLSALPLLRQAVNAPPAGEPRFLQSPNPRATYGREFFFASGNDALRMAELAREPTIAIGASLVLCAFAFTRRLFGVAPGLAAAALVVLCPNLVAHARLATEDLGCAAGMFAAVFCLWRCVERPGPARALVCGVVTGLALLTKYTALLLVPIFALLAFVAWRRCRERIAPPELAGTLAVVTGLAFAVVSLGYGLSFRPDRYWQGIFQIYPEIAKNYSFYLFGHVSKQPFWYHALVSVLIKTPLPTLGLIALAGWRARRAAAAERIAFVLLPPAVVIAASFFDLTNPGIRRVLPALPFLLSFASLSFAAPRTRAVAWIAALLLAGSALEAVRAWPHHLAYLNEAVGGSAAGPWVTDESNVDWGQELPRLAAWQREHAPQEVLHLFYFGSAEPSAYGVRAETFDLADVEHPRPGLYAISAHYLAYFRKLAALEGADSDWLSKYEPIDRIGYSIYVYRFGP